MAEITLVHGSCFGAWVWDGLAAVLRDIGHRVRAIDLPGRGGGATSLAAQGQAIVDASAPGAVLVGHSAGGYPITMAAELAPGRVAGLIYLAAYIPQVGTSVAGQRRAGPSQPMRGAFLVNPERTAYGFDPGAARDMFFHDCPDAAGLANRLCLEPIGPQESAFPALTHAPLLPRAAIIASADRAIPPDWQCEMAGGLACHDIASGHCPQLSRPLELAALISRILQG